IAAATAAAVAVAAGAIVAAVATLQAGAVTIYRATIGRLRTRPAATAVADITPATADEQLRARRATAAAVAMTPASTGKVEARLL
ncbi:MAG: hypothetical protein VW338_04785, partial [Rhodospirillaceae bacterium]